VPELRGSNRAVNVTRLNELLPRREADPGMRSTPERALIAFGSNDEGEPIVGPGRLREQQFVIGLVKLL
jgi:hypothetical protein